MEVATFIEGGGSPSTRANASRGQILATRAVQPEAQEQSVPQQTEVRSEDKAIRSEDKAVRSEDKTVRQEAEQGASYPKIGANTPTARLASTRKASTSPLSCDHEGNGSYERRGSDIAVTGAPASSLSSPSTCDHVEKGLYERRGSDIAVTRAPASLTEEQTEWHRPEQGASYLKIGANTSTASMHSHPKRGDCRQDEADVFAPILR